MKKIFGILICCLFISNSVLAEYYYYYKGQKIPLVINSDSVVVYTRNASLVSGFSEILPSMVAKNKVSQLLTQGNAMISSIEYVIGDTITRKMSNCFYVKLYQSSDSTILRELVDKTHTILLGEVPYMNNWYKIMVANSTINNSLEMSNYFYETGLFADIDPGFVFEFAPNCVNDSEFSSQWALPAINACEAWTQTIGRNNIVVAVVDHGIEQTHSEFVGTAFSEFAYDCYRNQQTNSVYGDHGTMVAGVIGANHNYGNMAGLAPNITIMPISHPLSGYSSGEQLASGISWAVEHGTDVINCSWGDWDGFYQKWLKSALLEEALLNAVTNGRDGKGCVVVFASGNAATNKMVVDYPANFTPELLVVGSINASNKKSTFSGFGTTLDVVAPGEDIYLANYGNSYCISSGTSFAAPYVSAVASLILSVNPNLTREDVVNIIETTAQKVGDYDYVPHYHPNGGWNIRVGYGLVDAYAAVMAAKVKYIQNQVYANGSMIVETYPEIVVGYSVTENQPYGNVVLEAGSNVSFIAQGQVVLKSGFHAKAGSEMSIMVRHIPSDSATLSVPQRLAPRSSSAPADNTEAIDEVATNNSLENVESEIIQSTAIYTVSGQLLQIVVGGQRDAVHLPNGMYILQHRMSDGSMWNEKVTKYK